MHKNIRRMIGLYELLTGGYGALALVYSILLARGGSLSTLLFLVLCTLNAIAGSWLWSEKPGGVRLSIFTQLLQTVSLSAGTFRFLFTDGLSLRLFMNNGMHFAHSFGPNFDWGWSWGHYPFEFGVNLMALAMFIYLIYASRTSGKSA